MASLLTVLLLDRMEYLTEVLRLLLLRLVSATSATKHPQLILRRTESVVEKMLSNWLALCMYNYLKVSFFSFYDYLVQKQLTITSSNRVILGLRYSYYTKPSSIR